MKKGKAYGFFDCRASKKEIETELHSVRDSAQIPSELELSLIDGVDRLEGDSDLMSIVRKAKESGMRYAMEAIHPNATNRATAEELAAILNQAYQSPLYQEGEQFRGEIVYEENGEYSFFRE